MVLACDIGNSRIKAGIFTDKNLTEVFVCNNVQELIEKISLYRIREVAISSVVPANSQELQNSLYNLDISPFIISKDSEFNLSIDYKSPDTLGMDRLCSAEGAYFLNNQKRTFRQNHLIITIDFGTASTINIVTYPGVFSGGMITPGIDLMFRSLSNDTAQLPLVYENEYKDLIGKSTRECIASGVMNSAAGFLQWSLRRIQEEFEPEKTYIYVTGGNYERIKPFIGFTHNYKEALVLYGIKAIYNKNREAEKTPTPLS
jgi:type III pantothenate kinase